jgi:hypothetical protein
LDDFVHFEYLKVEPAPQVKPVPHDSSLPSSAVTPGLMPGLMNANSVLENWTSDFEYMTRTTEWGVLTYTCHPYVIGRGHRMMMLERLLLNLMERGAVFHKVEDVAREYLSSLGNTV